MYRTSLFPLRTIVGNAIPISHIREVFGSTESKKLGIKYGIHLKPSIADTKTDNLYADYFPTFAVDGTTLSPGEGMDNLPVPPRCRPFADNDQVISFFALSNEKAAPDISRKLSARFSLLLPNKFLVGGICFGGYPYLHYSRDQIRSDGLNSSNFGLPREIRLSCSGSGASDEKDTSFASEFLDAEISSTQQDIVSHSGFNFLCIDPTLTQELTVYFSDYPTILRKAEFDGDNRKFNEDEFYGFIIPYFYVFEFMEKTRYRPVVSAGLLGTTTNSKTAPEKDHPFANSIDYKHIVRGAKACYFDFTAASIFGQQRTYTAHETVGDPQARTAGLHTARAKKTKGKPKETIATKAGGAGTATTELVEHAIPTLAPPDLEIPTRDETLKECFISIKVLKQENVVLYIEQAEEYERCIGGLKIFFPFIPKIGLGDDLHRLAEQAKEFLPGVQDLAEWAPGVPREELEKYLRAALKIPKNIDFCEKIGIRVYELDPLEGVSPLKVELDGKYATLLAEKQIDELSEIALALFLEGIRFVKPSNARFFAIELTNADEEAGQFVIKGMQLIQSAHVSVHPRAAKTQQVKTLNFRIIGADLAEDYSFLGKEGFNFTIERLVAGEKKSVLFRANSLLDLLHTGAVKIFHNARRRAVESYESQTSGWRRTEAGPKITGMNYWTGDQLRKLLNGQKAFEVFNTQEVRNHSKALLPRISTPTFWKAMADYFNVIQAVSTLGGDPPPISSNGNLNSPWRNQTWNPYLLFPEITGLQSLSVNPFSPVKTILEAFENLLGRELTPVSAIDSLRAFLGIYLSGTNVLAITGGGSSSVSISPAGVGITVGVNPVPTINNHTAYGSTGSINIQASETGHSYSQYLNTGYEEGVVTRAEVPGTDQQRVKGAEVMWQGELVDIITGAIPLNFTLPATASKMHFRTSDDSLRVRFGSGVGRSISVDFWFDLTEEIIRDDN